VVRDGRSRILTVDDADPSGQPAIACLPLQTNRPYGLIVLEHFRMKGDERDAVKRLLVEAVHRIEQMFEIEQGVESQDILDELTTRIADRASQLQVLPPELRIQPALEFTLQLLAADVTVWIPEGEARPVIAQPQTREAAAVLAEIWDRLEEQAAHVRDNGVAACGAEGMGWEQSGPQGPVPYVGVKAREGNGVLLAYLSPRDPESAGTQIPARVLTEALERVAGIIEAKVPDIGSAETVLPRSIPTHALGSAEISGYIHEQWEHSQQMARSFTLTRFTLLTDPETASQQTPVLRNYLLAEKRTKDVLAEIRDGVFVILSGESDLDADGIGRRLRQGWEELNPEFPVGIESTTCPKDGTEEAPYQAWVADDEQRRKAA
jgi:hypothetical protein